MMIKEICLFFLKLAAGVLGWLAVAPVAAAIPKRKSWVAVIGRHDGNFLDNAKYYYLQTSQNHRELRTVFITEHKFVHNLLSVRRGMHVMQYPTPKAIYFLLRCNTVIVDDPTWYRHYRAFLVIRAKVIQLWHGAGFKWAELGQWRREVGRNKWSSHPRIFDVRIFLYWVTRRHIRYAAVTATSNFYRDQVFKRIFNADYFLTTGYPRDDFAKSLVSQYRDAAWENTDKVITSQLASWKEQERHLVLVAPTFRHSGTSPMALTADVVQELDVFAAEHRIEFLFKFHPAERNADYLPGKHFHICQRQSDIYPLFPWLSALVTDYSSIAMDFLLVGRPILMLIPENDDYVEKDRGLQFDPREMIPGRLVTDWHRLMPALLEEWERDTDAESRAAMRSKVFDDLLQSEAVPRLLDFMRAQGWVCSRPRSPHRNFRTP